MDKIKYDFYTNPSKSADSQKSAYHIRICNQQVVDTDELVKAISNQCTLTPADIKAVLTAFNGEIGYHLERGNIVVLDGLCRFEISLTTTTGICTGKENGNSIQLKRVNVQPDGKLVKLVSENLSTCIKSRGTHSTPLSDIEVLGKLTEHFAYQPTINSLEFQQICSITRYMARRHINRLVAENKLVNIGHRIHPIYRAVPGNFGVSSYL
ncbi:MAG: HU family DNA-binding protein [Phocaeicola sp.]